MSYKRCIKCIFSLTSTFVLLINSASIFIASAADGKGQDTKDSTAIVDQIIDNSERSNNYLSYDRKYSSVNKPLMDTVYGVELAAYENAERMKGPGRSGETDTIHLKQNGSVTWTISVAEEGRYCLSFGYYAYNDDAKNIVASLKIDGESPFVEMQEFEFNRYWKDAEKISVDKRGNDIRPKQQQIQKWSEYTPINDQGLTYKYSFYLTSGEHTVSIHTPLEGLALESLRVYNEEIPNYQDYLKQHASGKNLNTPVKLLQGENYKDKNDSSIRQGVDKSSADTIPSDPYQLKLNILSGSTFHKQGQRVTWDVYAEETGYYKLGIRFRQNTLPGVFVSRNIYIDDAIPFQEYSNVQFQYTTNWKYEEIGDPYLVYLEQGNHTITLEVTTGSLDSILSDLEDSVYVMNSILRKIIMITSTTPDLYRDYSLDKEIPDLVSTMNGLSVYLKDLYDRISGMTGQKGGIVSTLMETSVQLQSFSEDTAEIPARLENYKSNISAISSLMMSLQSQALDIDYMTIAGADTTYKGTENNFFDDLKYKFLQFISTFYMDYNAVGDVAEKNETIKVWYGGSREQAEIVRRLIDEDFSVKHNVGVKLELVQITLYQAVLAGTAPDAVINVSRTQPINLSARGALAELSSLDGFDELRSQFIETAFDPYTYKNGVYALPVTMDYHVLFTRDDIMQDLGLEVPNTWQDVYKILPIIQRNNMEFGLPYSTLSSQATIEGGIGARDLFVTLIYQNGGKVYKEDMSSVDLDSEESLAAFKEWTEFYTKYGFTLTYDFYNRFRSGEMPIGIASYGMYNVLNAAAPEIRGLWSMHLIPGTLKEDGTIDHSEAASGSGAVLLNSSQSKDTAWEFLKWWVGEDAQTAYGLDVETQMGTSARHGTANIKALERLPWRKEQIATLQSQLSHIKELPELLGGYYVSRSIDNAFRGVLFNSLNYKNALQEQIINIESELNRKQKEFQ